MKSKKLNSHQKRAAIKRVVEGKETQNAVAKDIGVTNQTVGNWVKKARASKTTVIPNQTKEFSEYQTMVSAVVMSNMHETIQRKIIARL